MKIWLYMGTLLLYTIFADLSRVVCNFKIKMGQNTPESGIIMSNQNKNNQKDNQNQNKQNKQDNQNKKDKQDNQ